MYRFKQWDDNTHDRDASLSPSQAPAAPKGSIFADRCAHPAAREVWPASACLPPRVQPPSSEASIAKNRHLFRVPVAQRTRHPCRKIERAREAESCLRAWTSRNPSCCRSRVYFPECVLRIDARLPDTLPLRPPLRTAGGTHRMSPKYLLGVVPVVLVPPGGTAIP